MGRGVNVPTINERFMGMRPGGYLTLEDEALGRSLLGTGTELIEGGVGQRLGRAANRLAQRGLSGAQAEQAYADIGGAGELAKARLGGEVGGILARIYQGNRAFEQGKVMRAWDAELRAKERSDARRAAQQAAWWNSVSNLVGTALPMFGGGGVPGTSISEPTGNPADWGELPIALP